MAKKRGSKKRSTRRQASKKVKRVMHKHPTPLGATAGLLYAGYEAIAMQGDAGPGVGQPLSYIFPTSGHDGYGKSVSYRADKCVKGVALNVQKRDVLVPALLGVGVTALGPKIPIVGKPINRMVKRLSKGKVTL